MTGYKPTNNAQTGDESVILSRPVREYPNGGTIGGKKPYSVGIFLRHPHFDDTGFDTEIISDFHVMWAYSAKDMIDIARKTLVPPHYDPALISVVVDALDHDERVEG